MAEIVDLTAINSDDEQQQAAPTIDLTKDSDDEQPPVKRQRREAEAADGPIKIVAWNASGILPKSGKNRDKLARLVQRIGCLLYTSPSPRDATLSRMPSSA